MRGERLIRQKIGSPGVLLPGYPPGPVYQGRKFGMKPRSWSRSQNTILSSIHRWRIRQCEMLRAAGGDRLAAGQSCGRLCVMAITYGFQDTMLGVVAEAEPGGIPHPPTPQTPPGSQEPQVEATTCRDPEIMDCSGFIFMAVNEMSEIIPGAVQ